MSSSALYYPYIEFQDAAWLKSMALFYDRIYRIVPPAHSFEEEKEIKILTDSGDIGCTVDPIGYAKEASEIFRNKIESQWDASALDINSEEEEALDRLHVCKTDEAVRRMFNDLGFKRDEEWIDVPTQMASNYMLYLATVISEKNDLTLLTDKFPSWTAANYFMNDGNLPDHFNFHDIYGSKDAVSLYSLILQELCPVNIADIPSKKIILFRRKRKDEIERLQNGVKSLFDVLSTIDDMHIFKDCLRDELVKVKKAICDYKNSADILSIKDWIGINLVSFTGTSALLQALNITGATKSVLIGTGMAVGFVYGLNEHASNLRNVRRENPYSCLALMEKEFSNYTSQCGGGDINFHAYNCMEEYIND